MGDAPDGLRSLLDNVGLPEVLAFDNSKEQTSKRWNEYAGNSESNFKQSKNINLGKITVKMQCKWSSLGH